MLRQLATTVPVQTKGFGLHEMTAELQSWVAVSGLRDGLLTLFVRDDIADIQKAADQAVLPRWPIERLLPWCVRKRMLATPDSNGGDRLAATDPRRS